MPIVLLINGFKFFFYSNEINEPIHIHVTKGDGNAKIWLLPIIKFEYAYNFSNKDLKTIMNIVVKNKEVIKNKWNEYFKKR